MSPDTASTPAKASAWAGILRKAKKIFFLVLTFLVIVVAVFIYWKFFFTYSEGYRAGLLQKFSHKGTLFKTYEGEMILSSVSSTSNVAIASEKFFFSVTNKTLVPVFDTIQGQNVIVHYRQKNSSLFWRGDSPYLVDSVRIKKEPF